MRISLLIEPARHRGAKECAGPPAAGPLHTLQGGDVRRLEALGPLGYLEFNRLPFVERFVSFRLNGGEVDENVLARLALDEPKAFAGVKPLYSSLFLQLCFSFLFELSGAISTASSQKTKEVCKRGLADLDKLKVLQEQQTHYEFLILGPFCLDRPGSREWLRVSCCSWPSARR